MKSLGRSKEFSGKEKDFQQHSSLGVIKVRSQLNKQLKSRRQLSITGSCRLKRMRTKTETRSETQESAHMCHTDMDS